MRGPTRLLLVAAAALALPRSAPLAAPGSTPPPSPAAQLVGRWFDALDREAFDEALALTTGAARERTTRMVDDLQATARSRRARVDVRVRAIRFLPAEPGPAAADPAGALPVRVQFDVQIVGRKWFFRRVAKHYRGTARFVVTPAPAVILSFDGALGADPGRAPSFR